MHTSLACPSLSQTLRRLRGGSQPILAVADDQQQYVVKFHNNPQGRNVLWNEAAGSLLYSALGLPTPEWKPLRVTSAFLLAHRNCWLETPTGVRCPAEGLCFGSLYQAGKGKLLEVLPSVLLSRISKPESFWLAWVIDACAHHTDNRQAIFLATDDSASLTAVFIDHGNLFAGACGAEKSSFLASGYLDRRVYQLGSARLPDRITRCIQTLDSDSLWRKAQALPAEWKSASATSAFSACLNRLADSEHVRNLLDGMLEAAYGLSSMNSSLRPFCRKPPLSVHHAPSAARRLLQA